MVSDIMYHRGHAHNTYKMLKVIKTVFFSTRELTMIVVTVMGQAR